MSIKVLKQTERFGKDKIYKRWSEKGGKIIESHITFVRKIRNYWHDITRYDYDKEGPHLHLKLFGIKRLNLNEAQRIVKSYDSYANDLMQRLEKEVK